MALRIAVLGLGEAGGAIAADLAVAGVDVHAFDPRAVPTPVGVVRHDTAATAVADSQVVCALTAAADAEFALLQAIHCVPKSAVYADCATATSGLKTRLAGHAAGAGLEFVDVALMAPVPGSGLRTPALASGPGAVRFVQLLQAVGMPVEWAGDIAGQAATRKLLRSIVIKGFAALLIESLQAADAAGLSGETWSNLVDQFTAADDLFMRRIISGTYPHSLRRLHEMEAAAEMLTELGVGAEMTQATVASLRKINDGAPRVIPPG